MASFDTFVKEFHQTGFLHHAILIEGEGAQALAVLRDFVEQELGMVVAGNPDVFVVRSESLGVDEARELSRRQEMRAIAGTRKIFIVAVQTATTEAQNALLKTLEEPTEGTHLFFIVPYAEALLPTLRSRMTLVRLPHEGGGEDAHAVLAQIFLEARTIAARLATLKPLVDAKDKAETARFLDALIRRLRSARTLTSDGATQTLTELLRCRGYLAGRSPSIKMILEHAVSIVPMS